MSRLADDSLAHVGTYSVINDRDLVLTAALAFGNNLMSLTYD
ncbi:hypothetical protein ACPOL_5359 [Acidisarcina polymorpha]|uniref:Uncharacterized protein n=1 Tax=Acidisarcina polymorpha TaxID=2211140 RepID=A0A2Z5G731_9BACT|nr:hypothetical protein ACPOL_5359 [Acidisarcina polymorpha]